MKFQLGKQGITEGVITSLTNAFKTHKSIRISVLPSASEDRKTHMKQLADELCAKLPGTYSYTIIGFVIVLKRKGAPAH